MLRPSPTPKKERRRRSILSKRGKLKLAILWGSRVACERASMLMGFGRVLRDWNTFAEGKGPTLMSVLILRITNMFHDLGSTTIWAPVEETQVPKELS
ncbi:hypothetical protein IAR55_003144 [Kwoniella newhampshirensis]|uniref:Uncharacterized protein n=1 Tax=Kwoniella newhampshirensis TaxID=1651941 RepID=A0AAW0YR42_9TREE